MNQRQTSKKSGTKNTKGISYYALTRNGFYSFTSTLPLLIIYQIMAFYLTRSFLNANRSVAEFWLVGIFSLLGTPGFILLGLIGAGLIVYFYMQKKTKNIPVIKYFYLLMLLESVIYSFFLALL